MLCLLCCRLIVNCRMSLWVTCLFIFIVLTSLGLGLWSVWNCASAIIQMKISKHVLTCQRFCSWAYNVRLIGDEYSYHTYTKNSILQQSPTIYRTHGVPIQSFPEVCPYFSLCVRMGLHAWYKTSASLEIIKCKNSTYDDIWFSWNNLFR